MEPNVENETEEENLEPAAVASALRI